MRAFVQRGDIQAPWHFGHLLPDLSRPCFLLPRTEEVFLRLFFLHHVQALSFTLPFPLVALACADMPCGRHAGISPVSRSQQPLFSRRASDFPAKRPKEFLPALPSGYLVTLYNSVKEGPLSFPRETQVQRGQGRAETCTQLPVLPRASGEG